MRESSPTPPPSLAERWLGSLPRRLVLQVALTLGLAALTAQISVAIDVFDSFHKSWGEMFLRSAATIASWVVLFEPLRFVAHRLARLGGLALVVHVVLSLGVASTANPVHTFALDLVGQRPPSGPGPKAAPSERAPVGAGREWGGGFPRRPSPGESRTVAMALLAYWALLALSWGIDRFLDGRASERREAALAADLQAARLTNLQHQLRPHFLFNALHSVAGLVRGGRRDEAVEMLSQLGGLLRGVLEREVAHTAPLADELETAEALLAIEGERLGERLQVDVRMDVAASRAVVPALLLLPLVENAVQHGVAPRAEGGSVTVEVAVEGAELVVRVSDDGPGFPDAILRGGVPDAESASPVAERTSIGLANTRARLEGLYGPAARLELFNEHGAVVVVRLPLTYAGGEAP